MYVDTSVIVAMLTNEPKTQACKDWFGALTITPVSSDWLITEFNSAIALKHRLGQLAEKDVNASLQQFEQLTTNGGLRLLPIARECFVNTGQLIHQYNNTRAGDALHLSTALMCEAKQFITLDIAQALTAEQLGFEVIAI